MVEHGLGRLIEFDEKSRQYPIRQLVAAKPLRSYTWSVGVNLDQGNEGSCVGHAWAHELCARPVVELVDHTYAREKIYWEAQKIDEYPGGDYPGASPQSEGSSVLAGAKVCQSYGHFQEYRWAFGLNDLLLALGYSGPAVLGINWYNDMFDPDADGRLHPTGGIAGGHAILAYRIWLPSSTRPEGQVWLWNSWGAGWGKGGAGWLTFADMETLLHEEGEACIPVGRKTVAP